MIRLESVQIYSKSLPAFSSYEDYEDTLQNFIVGDTPETFGDFLRSRPIKTNLVMDQSWWIAEVYWNSDSIENIISERFFKIPEVEGIFFSMENDLIEVRTVINKYDKDIAKTIYIAECDIIETFGDYFFDFLIIYRDDRKIDDICPSESIIIFRR